jgi:hypothetical protein
MQLPGRLFLKPPEQVPDYPGAGCQSLEIASGSKSKAAA